MLRYPPGADGLQPHLDYIRGEKLYRGWPRAISLLVYLNDVKGAGGDFAFVRAGLRVKSRRGRLIIFESGDAEANEQPKSMHAGMPLPRTCDGAKVTECLQPFWPRNTPSHPLHPVPSLVAVGAPLLFVPAATFRG